jgi:hypothetical protein
MILASALAAILTLGSTRIAAAQDFVPGGWSADVVHQSLGPLTTVTPTWGTGQVAYSPYGVYQPSLTTSPSYSSFVQAPTTTNGLIPLGKVIQRSKSPKAKRSR